MNFLKVFEDRASDIFGASRAPFSFKKLAKQAAHEMEDQTLVINGVDTAPALYTILVSQNDDALLAQFYPQLTTELSQLIKAQAEKRKYTFVGEPLVRFMIDPALKPGRFSVFAENIDAPTLARLYEEERSYLSGASQGFGSPAGAGARGGAGLGTASPAMAGAAPAGVQPQAQAARAAAPGAPDPYAASQPDPFAPAMPATVSRDMLSGNAAAPAAASAAQAGAAAGNAAMGAAPAAGLAAAAAGGIAANMVNARNPQAAAAGTAQPAPQQAQPQAPLAEFSDVVSGQVIPIVTPRCIVGRERGSADVILRDPNVSRRHAELSYTGSGWSIEDLGSTNGTSVNNRRITRCPLRSGDLVTFGLTTFEFRG